MFDGDVAAAGLGVARRADLTAREPLVDERDEIVGQGDGFLANGPDAGLLVDVERALQRRGREHMDGADLPRASAVGGRVGQLHVELRLLVVAPPAREPRHRAEVPFVDVQAADGAGTGVEIFVGTPDGEVDADG